MTRGSWAAPSAGVAFAILVSLAVALAGSSPRAGMIAAVFPPWWSSAHVFAAAGSAGDIVAVGFPSAIVVVRDDAPDFAARLRRSGALITLDARAFVACGTPQQEGPR